MLKRHALLVLCLFLGIMVIGCGSSTTKNYNLFENEAKTSEGELSKSKGELKSKLEKTLIDKDGSSIALTKYIKDNMKNPKSYEHVSTEYFMDYDKGTVRINTKIRGTNSYGGVVSASYIAEQDIMTGKIITVDTL